MIHVAFFCLLIGQVPPPPMPHPPESYKESTPADSQAEREWLLDHLFADLQAQGKLDAQKRQEVERMVNRATDLQIAHAVQHYRDLSAQVEAQKLAEAQANLRRLQAYRDDLKREVERRKEVYQKEQAMMAYGSALAAQQAQWAMGNFYAAPYYYAPYPHHHHHW